MDATFEFLKDNYPTIFVITIIIIVVSIIVWKVSSFYHTRFKKIETFSQNTPCNEKGYAANVVAIIDIKESIRKIEEYLIKKDASSIDKFLRKCSPYSITDLGNQLLEKSNGKKCIDENTEFFIKEIEKMNPLVALDVEQYSLTVLNDNIKNERFNHIKNFIYNASNMITFADTDNSSIDVSVELSSVLLIMSIYLRDKYFEVHPEIDLTDFYEK